MHRHIHAVFCITRQQVADDLRVRRCLEERACLGERIAQFFCVGQVAIMGQRELTLIVVGNDRLCVQLAGLASRRVTHMPNGKAPRKPCKNFFIKNVVDETQALVEADLAVIPDSKSAPFLATMLQCEEPQVSELCHIHAWCADRKDATLFVDPILSDTSHIISPLSLWIKGRCFSDDCKLRCMLLLRRQGLF